MTQLKWYDLARIDLDDEPENMTRNTPKVQNCEWDENLAPKHDVKRFLMIIVPLFIATFALLYAGAEIMVPLRKVWTWLGLP